MTFRLVYHGALPAVGSRSNRVQEKHAVRRVLQPQLKRLWETHPLLKIHYVNRHVRDDHIVKKHSGFEFLPLVSQHLGLVCAVDILFLRREKPGQIIGTGGDIDNRLKVLFDAFRVPTADEIKNESPSADESPFHCLTEDDALITQVSVTTDMLLTPLAGDAHEHDVSLIVRVETIALDTPTI